MKGSFYISMQKHLVWCNWRGAGKVAGRCIWFPGLLGWVCFITFSFSSCKPLGTSCMLRVYIDVPFVLLIYALIYLLRNI